MYKYYEVSERTTELWLRFRQEVLLSYRILFGRDKASRKLFHKITKRRAQNQNTPLDPLLETLCSRKTSDAKITGLPAKLWPKSCRDFDDNLRKQDEYSIASDLSLLGPRLLALQTFNLRQKPRNFWALWRDKRDQPKWYTFWVVLIVGVLALILAIAQVALSAAQLGK